MNLISLYLNYIYKNTKYRFGYSFYIILSISVLIKIFIKDSTIEKLMSSEANLKELFEKWYDLNNKVQELMAGFDLANVKKIRKKQQGIEDLIYVQLKQNAPNDYIDLLPEDCGELEVGYDTTNNEFYFVMIDPKTENEENIKLIAFTVDLDKYVRVIENFKIED